MDEPGLEDFPASVLWTEQTRGGAVVSAGDPPRGTWEALEATLRETPSIKTSDDVKLAAELFDRATIDRIKVVACEAVCRWCLAQPPVAQGTTDWYHHFTAYDVWCRATPLRRAWREAGF